MVSPMPSGQDLQREIEFSGCDISGSIQQVINYDPLPLLTEDNVSSSSLCRSSQ